MTEEEYIEVFSRNALSREGQIKSDFSTWKSKINHDLRLLNMALEHKFISEEVFDNIQLMMEIELVMVDKTEETIFNFFKKED